MTRSSGVMLGAAATATVLLPMLAGPAGPAAAQGGSINTHTQTICGSGANQGQMYSVNIGDTAQLAATEPQGAACKLDYLYTVKIKYKQGAGVYYAAAPWGAYGEGASLTTLSLGGGTVLASCHGYRSTTAQPWNYTYLGTSNPSGGTQDCDDAGAW